ncbi:MAG TPA: hypothetical protein VGF59_04060 [Bryobacteraceae bacterium]
MFALFPETRDIPWANYLLFAVGGVLLAIGVKRAFGDPEHYRGKISGSILAALSVLIIGFFVAGVIYFAKQVPSSETALRVNQTAPAFLLADASGKQVSSADLLKDHRAVVLVFYRGYW